MELFMVGLFLKLNFVDKFSGEIVEFSGETWELMLKEYIIFPTLSFPTNRRV